MSKQILKAKNVPYVNEAEAAIDRKNRNLDPKLWQIKPHGDGFMLEEVDDTPAEKDVQADYYYVTFRESDNPSESADVIIGHNGLILQFMRGTKVICPATHLHVAELAKHRVYEQQPGHDRKVVKTVAKYSWTIHGPATKNDFDESLKQGNKEAASVREMMQNNAQ